MTNDTKEQKTKACKKCKMDIPAKAKKCPHCRSKQGAPIVLIIIGVLVVFGIIGSLSGGKDEPTANVPPETPAVDSGESSVSDEPATVEPTESPASDSPEPPVNDEPEPTAEPKTRDNSQAQLTTLYSGTFAVGEDIPAGRYVVTGVGNGNFFVYESGLPIVNEILDDGSMGFGFGVPSITTDLKEGNEIEISGINEVVFTPAETSLQTELSTGTWVVGLDILPGKYEVTCEEGQSGNFFVYSKNGFPEVNEILGKNEAVDFGVERIRVNLKEEQVIGISGITKVYFTEQ